MAYCYSDSTAVAVEQYATVTVSGTGTGTVTASCVYDVQWFHEPGLETALQVLVVLESDCGDLVAWRGCGNANEDGDGDGNWRRIHGWRAKVRTRLSATSSWWKGCCP